MIRGNNKIVLGKQAFTDALTRYLYAEFSEPVQVTSVGLDSGNSYSEPQITVEFTVVPVASPGEQDKAALDTGG